ncbi:dihydrodipicolinate synthase family protein [bacterium]|nr:dihydrodipicolinate synthase family protein [bacterium]
MTDVISMLKPKRKLTGISAILLPFEVTGGVDYPALAAHVARTAEHGLIPAINMDTGFGHLIDDETKMAVMKTSREVLGDGQFVAGAFVSDEPGAEFNGDEYKRQMEMIQQFGGTPVIFQSYGLTQQSGPDIVAAYADIASACDRFIGFELTPVLGPFGSVYDLETYGGLMEIPQCIGAKHSSFERQPEWDRLKLRDARRPGFKVFTGNDFGIDMVMYGSDYLLGLSTFCPDLFAKRDAYWEAGDARFYELNDLLQYLGFFAFRSPGPGYKHTAAQFMKLRGWIDCDNTHPQSPKRPDSDVEVLRELGIRLGVM